MGTFDEQTLGGNMILSYKGKSFEIETNENSIKINGVTYPFSLEKCSDNILKININGNERVVYFANDGMFSHIFIDGEQYLVQKTDDSSGIQETENNENKSEEQIKPPMPGSVVKLLVQQGQKVDEGAPIIVVEAMKMEITLYSSISGTVTEINAEAGQQVDADRVLVVIKRNEND